MKTLTPYYIFQHNLAGYKHWKQRFPELKAIWYDGESSILDEFQTSLRPSRVIIEPCLWASLEPRWDRNLSEIIQDEDSPHLSEPIASGTDEKKTCVLPSNDTHVYLFQYLRNLPDGFEFCILPEKHEAADQAMQKLGIPYLALNFNTPGLPVYNGLLLANDWGPHELFCLRRFQRMSLPVACLQESVIKFGDRTARMEWCDFPIMQGLVSLRYLDREIYFMTGNPRYEHLTPLEKITSPGLVLINCNFTYGIYEHIRESWIADVVGACNQNRFEFLIAQHPRDRGNLSGYPVIPSGAEKIHSLLQESSILITRFSSLIHESLAMGRRVIYYNPHQEKMHYNFEPDGQHLAVAQTKQELTHLLQRWRSDSLDSPLADPFYQRYSMRHHGSADGKASQRLGQAMKIIAQTDIRPPHRHIPTWRLLLRSTRHQLRTHLSQRLGIL